MTKKEKGLMDKDNSVVIVRGQGVGGSGRQKRGINDNGKIQ